MDENTPQAITAQDRFFQYWMERLVKEQEKTNELLLQIAGKPKRKPKTEDPA